METAKGFESWQLERNLSTICNSPDEVQGVTLETSMNCLVCGHKLAIFRKLSLGDFCCQEHRALFLKEHNEKGLARLLEPGREAVNRSVPSQSTRVYAQFLHRELYALSPVCRDKGNSVGHGPLTVAQVIAPPAPRRTCSPLAPALETGCVEPRPGVTSPIYFRKPPDWLYVFRRAAYPYLVARAPQDCARLD